MPKIYLIILSSYDFSNFFEVQKLQYPFVKISCILAFRDNVFKIPPIL